MGRHRSSPPSTKHKSKSKRSTHEKHKKHKLPSTSTSTNTNTNTSTTTTSSRSLKSKPKRVSFGGVSSGNEPPTHSSSSSHHHQQYSRSRPKGYAKEDNPAPKPHKHHSSPKPHKHHSSPKPHKHHSSTKDKEHSTAKPQVSNDSGKRYKSYSSTSGILKSREKHPHRLAPNPKITLSTSSSIPTPTQRNPKPSKKPLTTTKKPAKAPSPPPPPPPHPYSTRFSDLLYQKTTHLLTLFPAQLNSTLTTILNSLSQINISPTANESYSALTAAHRASILAKYGSAMPLGVIRKFQADCREWDRKLKGLLIEREGVQKELVELAREVGIVGGGTDGSRDKEAEEDVEFEEMIKEIRQVGKTYVAKMDKLEQQIFQEEARQNMLMMQAM